MRAGRGICGIQCHLCLSSNLRCDDLIVLPDAAGRKEVVSPHVELHAWTWISANSLRCSHEIYHTAWPWPAGQHACGGMHHRNDTFACMVLKRPEKVACGERWEMRTSQMESPKNAKAVGLYHALIFLPSRNGTGGRTGFAASVQSLHRVFGPMQRCLIISKRMIDRGPITIRDATAHLGCPALVAGKQSPLQLPELCDVRSILQQCFAWY